jgi:hypothetical protein
VLAESKRTGHIRLREHEAKVYRMPRGQSLAQDTGRHPALDNLARHVHRQVPTGSGSRPAGCHQKRDDIMDVSRAPFDIRNDV